MTDAEQKFDEIYHHAMCSYQEMISNDPVKSSIDHDF